MHKLRITYLKLISTLLLLIFFPDLIFQYRIDGRNFNNSRIEIGHINSRVLATSVNNPLNPGNVVFLPLIENAVLTFFVSTDGNDLNPGSFELPWRTIGKAARMASLGMIIYIRGGVYNEIVEIRASGTESQPIKFIAYPSEIPIIDGYNQVPSYWVGLFSILGDWIYVSGIEIRNSRYDGIGLYGDHDTANNVFVHDNQYRGILIKGNFGIVQYSHVWRNSLINENGSADLWTSGITAAHDFDDGIADGCVIMNNTVWENWGEGISTHQANGTTIYNNVVFDNWSANIYISDAINILTEGNFIYATGITAGGTQVGIMMGDEAYSPPSANVTIINNIVYQTNRNYYWWPGVEGGGLNNVLIANNTFINSVGTSGIKILPGNHQASRFYNNLSQQNGDLPIILIFESDPGLQFSNNLWSKPPDSYASSPSDIIGDPLLEHTNEPYNPLWFSLTELSPAINNGTILGEIIIDYF